MPSTHVSLHYHIVFSTKDREPLIPKSWRERLHSYLGGVVRTANGTAEAVGGVADHAHLLLGLRATHCLADIVRDIKTLSSRWVGQEGLEANFSWQEGYGAFTVSPHHRDAVRKYISNQEAHHQSRTFQEEYIDFLHRGGVEYDERYLW